MYRPSAQFRRSPQERADQVLSWNRSDVAFFAAGACHILAFAFLETYPRAGFRTFGLWARDAQNPMHVYVAKGECAFDHDGWTPASELIAVSRAAEPAADYEAQPIDLDLDDFCRRHNHRARQYFAFDPWDRAVRFIRQFPAPDSLPPPPTESQAADS